MRPFRRLFPVVTRDEVVVVCVEVEYLVDLELGTPPLATGCQTSYLKPFTVQAKLASSSSECS